MSPLYKVVNVNIDPSGKSDREEYGTLRYHGNYSTSAAFELELRWIVGTGTILEELVGVTRNVLPTKYVVMPGMYVCLV